MGLENLSGYTETDPYFHAEYGEASRGLSAAFADSLGHYYPNPYLHGS